MTAISSGADIRTESGSLLANDSRRSELESGYDIDSVRVRRRFHVVACSAVVASVATAALAGPVYQPPGANLTYGDVTHGQRASSAAGNPAAAAADVARFEDDDDTPQNSIVISAVAGLEFGNLDEFYDRIDEISDAIKPSPPEDGDPGIPPGEPPGGGIGIGEIIDICCPDLRELIDRIEQEVTNRLGLLTLISVDGYGKAFESVDVPVLIGNEMAGGAWTFGLNWSGSSKAYSFVDDVLEFDPTAALADLTNQYNLMPGDPETSFDIVGDVDVVVDPGSGLARAILNNDSAMVTKASQTTELLVGYSRRATRTDRGSLFLGAEAKYYDLKLSRASVRFGDITNSEDLFEAIRDADFRNDSGFGVDVGALWVAERYQLGASLTNINEPTFIYPDVDLSNYSNGNIISRLLDDQSYTMERQLKLESSVFTPDRRWAVNFGVDANAVEDPMGDDFQWFTVSAGWTTNTAWLPNVRVGYRRNLAGSELDYLGVGVTAFKWFNIDLASEIHRIELDGDKLPRGVMLSLGFQLEF